MVFSVRNFVAALAATTVFISESVQGRQLKRKDIHAKQVEAARRFQSTAPIRREAAKNLTFSNPKATRKPPTYCYVKLTLTVFLEFFVDGKSIPDVDFDVGPSWSGLLPISGDKNETREVWHPLRSNIHSWTSLMPMRAVSSSSSGSSRPVHKALQMI